MKGKFHLLAALLLLTTLSARGEGGKNPSAGQPPETSAPSPESDVEVEPLRKEYWKRGDETPVRIVQYRQYVKRRKFELGIAGGPLMGDAFLQTWLGGASLAFHISELFSLNAYTWLASVGPSNALRFVQSQYGNNANTNNPKSFWGAEARANLIYGKFSLMGITLVHFDIYAMAGAGNISTETGSSLALTAGICQQFHLSQRFALNITSRLMEYHETIISKITGSTLGQNLGTNTNLSMAISLGLSVFFDPLG